MPLPTCIAISYPPVLPRIQRRAGIDLSDLPQDAGCVGGDALDLHETLSTEGVRLHCSSLPLRSLTRE